MSKLKRSEKLAFLAVTDGEEVAYHRLKNFTEFSVSKNPVNYSRQYIDEDFKRNDVVSYAPSISYSFDYDNENPSHSILVNITDNELVGDGALVSIVFVDTASDTQGECPASQRQWSVVPDKEGSDSAAYDYSGTFYANGKRVVGTATTEDNWETCSFVAI
ncbi:MAG: hypothetical protein IKC07_02165 [Clostridia bacterium]|nr:hypothetical protein [Clostridia bacterium]